MSGDGRPFLGGVQEVQDVDPVGCRIDAVDHNIGRAADDQLAGARLAASSS